MVASNENERPTGPDQMRAWMRRDNWTTSTLGGHLGVSRQYISGLLTGNEVPSPEMAFTLEDVSGGAVQARRLLLRGQEPLKLVREKRRITAANFPLPSPSDLDLSDDGDALASAGFGTDEDYDHGDFGDDY